MNGSAWVIVILTQRKDALTGNKAKSHRGKSRAELDLFCNLSSFFLGSAKPASPLWYVADLMLLHAPLKSAQKTKSLSKPYKTNENNYCNEYNYTPKLNKDTPIPIVYSIIISYRSYLIVLLYIISV